MAQHIDKDALVAEIKKLENMYKTYPTHNSYEDALKEGRLIGYKDTLYKIDILEVKDVDLEKEIELVKGDYEQVDVAWNKDFDFIAKHFFELGIKARIDEALVEEVYSHIDSIKDTADRMTSGNFMHHRAAINVSANTIAEVLKLMGLKVQKGE